MPRVDDVALAPRDLAFEDRPVARDEDLARARALQQERALRRRRTSSPRPTSCRPRWRDPTQSMSPTGRTTCSRTATAASCPRAASPATATCPSVGERNVLMKNDSPPSTERFRPPSRPPCEPVSISTSPLIAAIAPASTLTSAPAPTSMRADSECRTLQDLHLHARPPGNDVRRSMVCRPPEPLMNAA